MDVNEFEGATVHFHNDADGCCSAAVVCRELSQFTLHAHGNPAVEELGEGKQLVLDIGGLRPEQVEGKDVTVIDHHLTDKLPCTHINPRFLGKNFPASFATWLLFGKPETAWIAGAGVIGDKGVEQSRLLFELIQQDSPELVAKEIEQEAMFNSPLGKITQMLDSNSSVNGEKGGIDNVLALISLTPKEILMGEGKAGKMKEAREKMGKEIGRVLEKEPEVRGRMVVLRYKSEHSVKSAIANELLTRYPDKVIVVAQENGGVRASLRGEGVNLAELAKKATDGIGSGGGHPEAAGLSVPAGEFERVLERMEKELG